MDPDIPVESIETGDSTLPNPSSHFTTFRDTSHDHFQSSSPGKTPFKTPKSHPATPSSPKLSSSPPVGRNGRLSTPQLQTRRSSSSLSATRGQTPSRLQIRKVPSNLNPSSPLNNEMPSDALPPLPPLSQPSSANAVAQDFFQRELDAHTYLESSTAVIVHDACYGHRFSRPRATRATLNSIVERPERIHAVLLGASTAYVRLGDRHAEGAYGPHPDRDVQSIPHRPFLLKKTTRSIDLDHAAVTHTHGTKWVEELQIMCDTAESKLAINGKELQRPIGYGKDEKGDNLPKLHEGDLYLCSESLAALRGCLGGVCDAVDTVFSPSITKRAFVCIRPPGHHCSSNLPSGFCWLNNVHVGISYAAMEHGLTHAAIFDFDLHHGDGSQTIAWDHNQKAQSLPKNAAQHKKTPIGYYSLHDINSYPCEWGDADKVRNASLCIENAHGQSTWNVHLEPWTSMEHFWQLYETKYSILLTKARIFLQHHSDRLRIGGVQPRAAIFLSAGFDASQWESQGMQRHNVNVPTEFYARFTADVVALAQEVGLGVEDRIISVLEGGYSDRALMSGVLSHLCGLTGSKAAASMVEDREKGISNGLQNNIVPVQPIDPNIPTYHCDWWAETNLEAIENRVAGNVMIPPKKKEKVVGNYSSPTQASNAKMTDVARERSSLSAYTETRLRIGSATPEPPQAVDWITASYELSRLLIPSDRQILSCRHDELNAEATKTRQDRQSAMGVAGPLEPRMQLRTRGKAPAPEPELLRTASRVSNRRTTIAAVSELPDPSMPAPRTRRRSSAASSILSSFQDMKLDDNQVISGTNVGVSSTSVASGIMKDAVAKKAKIGLTSKKTASKVSSPRKARVSIPPSTAVLGPSTNNPILNSSNMQTTPTGNSPTGPTGSGAAEQPDGLDTLTNGMSKVSIKLKMPTLQEHEKNQKKAEEARIKKPRLPRKPPPSKPTKLKGRPSLPVERAHEHSAQSAVMTVTTKQPTDVDVDGFDNKKIMPDAGQWSNAPINSEGWNSTTSQSPHPTIEIIKDNNSQGHMLTDEQSSHQSMRPDSTSTVVDHTAMLKKETSVNGTAWTKPRAELPLFTSNSPIPFASPLQQQQHLHHYHQQQQQPPVEPDIPRQ